jgi:hypothetical protein
VTYAPICLHYFLYTWGLPKLLSLRVRKKPHLICRVILAPSNIVLQLLHIVHFLVQLQGSAIPRLHLRQRTSWATLRLAVFGVLFCSTVLSLAAAVIFNTSVLCFRPIKAGAGPGIEGGAFLFSWAEPADYFQVEHRWILLTPWQGWRMDLLKSVWDHGS